MKAGYIVNASRKRVKVIASDDGKTWHALKHRGQNWMMLREALPAVYAFHDYPEAQADVIFAEYAAELLCKGA